MVLKIKFQRQNKYPAQRRREVNIRIANNPPVINVAVAIIARVAQKMLVAAIARKSVHVANVPNTSVMAGITNNAGIAIINASRRFSLNHALRPSPDESEYSSFASE